MTLQIFPSCLPVPLFKGLTAQQRTKQKTPRLVSTYNSLPDFLPLYSPLAEESAKPLTSCVQPLSLQLILFSASLTTCSTIWHRCPIRGQWCPKSHTLTSHSVVTSIQVASLDMKIWPSGSSDGGNPPCKEFISLPSPFILTLIPRPTMMTSDHTAFSPHSSDTCCAS